MTGTSSPGVDFGALYAEQRRRLAELRLAYDRAWAGAGQAQGVGIPPDLTVPRRPGAELELPRRWAVALPSGRPLRNHASRIPRTEQASASAETSMLARNPDFMSGAESLVLEAGDRLTAWFGTLPGGFDWIVTRCGPPQVTDLGYWLDTVAWSAHSALEAEGAAVDFEPEPALPELWAETLVRDLEWQMAVQLDLMVPRDFRPPSAIADRPFALLRNPFRPILDLWRCGVMLAASFSSAEPTATLFVNGDALSAGVGP
jgi:hypothetical protein